MTACIWPISSLYAGLRITRGILKANSVLLVPHSVVMLLENRTPGDASTSDGPSSRTSCALRGLRWPGMPELLIRMVWLMEERLRKRWVWNRYRGRGNGWVGGRTKCASFSISPSGLSVRVWEIVRQKDVAARVRWISWNWKGGSSISQRLFPLIITILHLILFLLWVKEGCQERILMDTECICYLLVVFNWWFATRRFFAGLFWQCYNAKCMLTVKTGDLTFI